MLLNVSPDVLAMGLSTAALVVRGLDNSRTRPELIAYRRQSSQSLAFYWKNRSIASYPAIREYHKIHEEVGAVDQPPAPEKLITYIRRQRDLTASGAVVDCYNLVSAKTLLSIGAHDLAKLATPVTLRSADKDDEFVPLGGTAAQQVTGEYAYIDQHRRVICRLDVLQCEYSKVTPASVDVVFFLQGNRCLQAPLLLKGTWLLAEMIETFCGGRAELVAFFDAGPASMASSPAKPTVSIETFKRLDLRIGTVVHVKKHPSQDAISVLTVQLQAPIEALSPSSTVGPELIGRRVVVATGLYPLAIAGKQFTAYVLSAQQDSQTSVLQIEAVIPNGQRLY